MSGYIGINNKAKKIKSLYIGVNNVAKKVKSAYIGIYLPEYESKSLGTWSSLSDVDNFFNTYTPYNGWSGLKLGNYIKIQDGTYNTQWEIAGFNLEHNQLAADGTTYDNGYGICMIPKTGSGSAKWNTSSKLTGGYISSNVHTTALPSVANSLKTVLGDHLINRNVLLSSAVIGGTGSTAGLSSAYTWTTAYATLMSLGQMTGVFGQNRNIYDDGEANYKLLVFNYENYLDKSTWLRNIWGYDSGNRLYLAYNIDTDGSVASPNVTSNEVLRPLIYLR